MIELEPAKGYASRTFDEIRKTPHLDFLLDVKKRRGPVTRLLLMRDLLEFGNDKPKPNRDASFALAVHRVERLFRLPKKAKMLHLKDVFLRKDLEIWNEPPGLPCEHFGYKLKGAIRDDPNAIQRVRWFWYKVKRGEKKVFPDSCAYVWSHICDEGDFKVEAVWCYPATITFGEAMFALPLIEGYKERGPFAYGFEPANRGFRRLSEHFSSSDYKYGFDFKKFDKTVPNWLIDLAFDILTLNIDFVHYKDYGVADARAMIHVFYCLRDYFVNTTITISQGRRFRKTSGIASGSYFTQLVGSICKAIILEYVHLTLTDEYIPDSLYMGDDSSFRSRFDLDVFEVQKVIFNTFGMYINFEKSSKDKNVNKKKEKRKRKKKKEKM